MPSSKVRADYPALAEIAKIFARQSAASKRSLQSIKRQVGVLQGGDWIGQGATRFYREMDNDVMPSLNRLAGALGNADRTTRQISKIMKQAEEDAARIFRALGGAGAGGTVGAAVGAVIGAELSGDGDVSIADLLVLDPNSLFTHDYMTSLIGSQFRGAGSELGAAMNGLLGNPTGDELDEFLESIASLRGRPVDEIRAEYEKFQAIRDSQNTEQAGPVDSLNSAAHPNFMGSNTQMRYGSVVGDAFGIDPVFGAMLNPTGGLVGPGNVAIAGDDSPVGYHGVVHDAAGYLHNYHGIGPGYDYLGIDPIPTSNPLSGQIGGVAYWTGVIRGGELRAMGEGMMSGIGAAVDVGSWLFDKATSVF